MKKSEPTIGVVFSILKIYVFNAVLRDIEGKEKATAKIIYGTIWTWFLIYTCLLSKKILDIAGS